MLAIRVDGQLELFEEGHFLDAAWRLSECQAALSETEFPSEYIGGATGDIDVSDEGRIEVHFVDQIHRQLRLLGIEPGWDVAGLTNWLDRQISHPDITRTESTLFIHRVLTGLVESRGLAVEQLAGQKFRLRTAIADKIDQHRRAMAVQAFQRVLFSADAATIEVGPEVCFDYAEDRYPPNRYYEGAYRFAKHFFPLVGELKGEGEEFDCAAFIAQLDEVRYWVRNVPGHPESSFWLPTSTDRFYPDFVALLQDGRFLVVESKGGHFWSNDDSKEKRAVGDLWADLSKGTCLFVMPKGPDWEAIRAKIHGGSHRAL
ncbi:MAG: hypothetical protein ABR915_02620 [Thermoguttaceae bacterium]|jgi:type III restriction enzyme